jgi:S-methylmethionine-dependent homocysteine/selenocysteine methylase
MARHRIELPQREGRLFLTDGGLETTLIFLEGHELPYFAAFDLINSEHGRNALLAYYRSYLSIAAAHGLGFIFESPTWRASSDWGDKLGYSAAALADVNRRSIDLMVELRDAHQTKDAPMVISGCVGPRGDGYDPGRLMNVAQAEAYHAGQIATFSETQADMVTAITMTNANEAIGITRAAVAAGMPIAISFTLETDGCLPTGQSLEDAIGAVDTATRRAGFAPTPRSAVTPSSTRPRIWTRAIRLSSVGNTGRCVTDSVISTCSAAAAGPTIVTSSRFAWPASGQTRRGPRRHSGSRTASSEADDGRRRASPALGRCSISRREAD